MVGAFKLALPKNKEEPTALIRNKNNFFAKTKNNVFDHTFTQILSCG